MQVYKPSLEVTYESISSVLPYKVYRANISSDGSNTEPYLVELENNLGCDVILEQFNEGMSLVPWNERFNIRASDINGFSTGDFRHVLMDFHSPDATPFDNPNRFYHHYLANDAIRVYTEPLWAYELAVEIKVYPIIGG